MLKKLVKDVLSIVLGIGGALLCSIGVILSATVECNGIYATNGFGVMLFVLGGITLCGTVYTYYHS